jgi:hypothetical protein
MITNPVQFFTTGFGDWRRVLPAGAVRDLYTQIYPHGRRWAALPVPILEVCQTWVECDFARADGDLLTPMIPILTQCDRELLGPWCDALGSYMASRVVEALPALQDLAERYRNRWHTAEHILTILILWTINMWVLRRLLAGSMGRAPAHGDTGRYFLWGEELGAGPTAITGIRAIRGTAGYGLCLIICRLVDRPMLKGARQLYAPIGGVSAVDLLAKLLTDRSSLPTLAQQWGIGAATLQRWLEGQRCVRAVTPDEPPQVCIPVFGPQAIAQLAPVCGGIARQIVACLQDDFLPERLLDQCSFAHCPRPTVLCMLWHNSTYDATDRLIAQGVLPTFPAAAEAEWGVWLTSHPYGLDPTVIDHGESG